MIWILTASAIPTVVGSTVDQGKLSARVSDAPADLVILYGGEQDGSLGTCGCPNEPRGSLGRIHSYADAVRETGVPMLLLNAGNWLTDPVGQDNQLRADARIRNDHVLNALDGWDVLNISFRDLPHLGDRPFPPGAVSANLEGGPRTHRMLEVGDKKVAVVGVTAWKKAYLQPKGFGMTDPVQALAALLPSLREQADLVVVTSYGLGPANKSLAALDIDVLIDADTHRTRAEPIVVDDTVWVRSRYETQFLGELRLTLNGSGIEAAHDRAVSLDKKIPSAPGWKKRERAAAKALEAASL